MAHRAGTDIGLDQTGRLVWSLGTEVVKRPRPVKKTPDQAATPHSDLMKHRFTASALNHRWVTDLGFFENLGGLC